MEALKEERVGFWQMWSGQVIWPEIKKNLGPNVLITISNSVIIQEMQNLNGSEEERWERGGV